MVTGGDGDGGGSVDLARDRERPDSGGTETMDRAGDVWNRIVGEPRLVKGGERQSALSRILGKEPAAAVDNAGIEGQDVPPLERRSYRILRGRIEILPTLTVMNRQGQIRLFVWSGFAGADMDQPGELALLFDGAEGLSKVTVRGSGLERELLEGVKACRVESIQELDELAAAAALKADPAEGVVTGIWIAGGGREWSRRGAGG
jgi:hypothetical protein